MFRKTLCVLLSLLMLMSAFTLAVSAGEDALSFIVATDVHFRPKPKTAPVNFPGTEYYTADSSSNMIAESYAVMRQFLKEAAATDAQFVLICGDLAHYGEEKEHQGVAKLLSDFEQQTGKRVFVISGNHDFHARISVQRFKELYAAFGYDEALHIDPDTCSYTAELSEEYRLLAIDSTNHGGAEDGITPELLSWIDAETAQAEADGKKLIAMMHHNFLEHIRFQTQLLPAFITRAELGMKDRFLDWGVRYVFTGHQHGQDVTSYADKAGRTVYDVMTTSLNAYPCRYRTAVLSADGLDLKSHAVTGVDAADLPDGYTPKMLDELQHDLDAYAFGCFRNAFEVKKAGFVGEAALQNLLQRVVGEKLSTFLQPFFTTFVRTLFLPIYTPETPDGPCLAALSRELGLTVPQTDKNTVSDLLLYFVSVYYTGDERLPYYDPQIVLFMQCVYTSLFESMRTVNADTRKAILADLRSAFPEQALPFFVSAAGKAALGAVRDDRLLELTLLMLSPLIESFSQDDETADNSVFLPAETEKVNPVLAFLRQIFSVLFRGAEKVFSALRRIFKTYPLFLTKKQAD